MTSEGENASSYTHREREGIVAAESTLAAAKEVEMELKTTEKGRTGRFLIKTNPAA
jgi:hypothetical protein